MMVKQQQHTKQFKFSRVQRICQAVAAGTLLLYATLISLWRPEAAVAQVEPLPRQEPILQTYTDEAEDFAGRYRLVFQAQSGKDTPIYPTSSLLQPLNPSVRLWQTSRDQTLKVPHGPIALNSMAAKPIRVIVLVDNSKSVGDNHAEQTKAIDLFLNRLENSGVAAANRSVALWSFSDEVKIQQTFTSSRIKIKEAFDQLPDPNGATCLYDALGLAIERLKKTDSVATPTRQVILVLTDGRDELSDSKIGQCSKLPASDVAERANADTNARTITIPIYGLTFPTEASGSMGEADVLLRELIEQTGGQFAETDGSEANQLIATLFNNLRSQWELVFNTYPTERILPMQVEIVVHDSGTQPVFSYAHLQAIKEAYAYTSPEVELKLGQPQYLPLDNSYLFTYTADNATLAMAQAFAMRIDNDTELVLPRVRRWHGNFDRRGED